MSLIKCADCDHDISDQAAMCLNCGRPILQMEESPTKPTQLWNAVIKARTPINIFALAMMTCASILGYSATEIEGCHARTAFTYTIHAFLAVCGMFFLAILFVRKGIYHPDDLGKVKTDVLRDLGVDRPGIPAVLITLMLIGYGYYQYNTPTPCQADTSQHYKQTQMTPENNVSD
ncbi:MAG: hypothetical protein GY703_13335 [Gammaproteobacteria bacterium]|nr:hypothetical protein [Gammaproteobacteria bacterium]